MRDRGASTALGYVLTLGITLVLVVSLLSAAVSIVETERSRTVNSELSVLGNRLATELTTADSLVRAADDPRTVSLTAELPDRVAQGQYRIRIDGTDCFSPGDEVYVSFEWRIPDEVGNIIQSDSATFQVAFDPRPCTEG